MFRCEIRKKNVSRLVQLIHIWKTLTMHWKLRFHKLKKLIIIIGQ
jgi:hypothetical protein